MTFRPLKPGWQEKTDKKGNITCFTSIFILIELYLSLDYNTFTKKSSSNRAEAEDTTGVTSGAPQAKLTSSPSATNIPGKGGQNEDVINKTLEKVLV
jgi:hypothetical protein